MSNENLSCPNDANNSNCWCHRFMETHVYIYICIYISSVSNRLFKDVYVHACECMNILKGLFEIKLHQLR